MDAPNDGVVRWWTPKGGAASREVDPFLSKVEEVVARERRVREMKPTPLPSKKLQGGGQRERMERLRLGAMVALAEKHGGWLQYLVAEERRKEEKEEKEDDRLVRWLKKKSKWTRKTKKV